MATILATGKEALENYLAMTMSTLFPDCGYHLHTLMLRSLGLPYISNPSTLSVADMRHLWVTRGSLSEDLRDVLTYTIALGYCSIFACGSIGLAAFPFINLTFSLALISSLVTNFLLVTLSGP
ncbi:unnamed protein product [Mycena citricolor]|uniref:Uncharacterized protein n=1 Tax=Mycena citricolor TaxID=2018698 RepID=A0AAD2GTL3_9AGAR|nr:unnamed protein product [Mycena citricolor]